MAGGEKVDASATAAVNGDATTTEKKPCKLDVNLLLADDDNLPAEELLFEPANQRGRRPEKRKKITPDSSSAGYASSVAVEDYFRMPDDELVSSIERKLNFINTLGAKLPDNGAKLIFSVRLLQDELERRKLGRATKQDDCTYKKPMDSGSSNMLEGPKQAKPSSQASGQSVFGALLMKKLGNSGKADLEPKIVCEESDAFDCEISSLNSDEKQRRKQAGMLRRSRRPKPSLCPKKFSAWIPLNHSGNSQRHVPLNGIAGRASTGSLPLTKKRDASQPLSTDESKEENTVVLVDEEDSEFVQQKQEAEQLPSSISEGKIYYPSREDPESLEICYSELKCLEPGECLTSTIMNFYIRYLQELWSPSDKSQHIFYFFNTYFYSKLQKAVDYKKSDKEAFFLKFRRWWRGVNIFKKAYIFLPINENHHWSLVIVCIPDEEDDSGPMILHMDSLGLHYSGSIFYSIKSLLIKEWEYLKEENGALDIPIPERIWKNLPRRIDEKKITVPRQTNDYDCGLFVLYYMKRFINEAPSRLKREDLSMFGKKWFKPQEASRLRWEIKNILRESFHKATEEENHVFQTDKSKDEVKIS